MEPTILMPCTEPGAVLPGRLRKARLAQAARGTGVAGVPAPAPRFPAAMPVPDIRP